MTTMEIVVQAIVIIGFGIWAYTKVCRQTLKDTFLEIKELFTRG